MRLKILALAFSFVLAALGASEAFANKMHAKRGFDDVRMVGPEVPFPLSIEIPFPWNSIEGIWEAHGAGIDAHFSFEVREDYPDRKILKVVQLDPQTRAVVAVGVGVAVDSKKIVRAGMTSLLAPGENYMLFIRAFKDPDAKKGAPGMATVVTLRSFSNPDGGDVHIVVRKLSPQSFDGIATQD